MASLTVEMPDDYRAALDERVQALELKDAEAYIRKLIREDVNAARQKRLAALINEGLASGDSGMTSDEVKQHLLDRIETARGGQGSVESSGTYRESA